MPAARACRSPLVRSAAPVYLAPASPIGTTPRASLALPLPDALRREFGELAPAVGWCQRGYTVGPCASGAEDCPPEPLGEPFQSEASEMRIARCVEARRPHGN